MGSDGSDRTRGIVEFSIFPHLDHVELAENTMTDSETWAAGLSVPCYAIDDETAIKVKDGTVEVIRSHIRGSREALCPLDTL